MFWKDIPLSALWLIFAVILAAFEAVTLGLVTLWFAIGALFAMAAAILGVPFQYQLIIFIVVSGILLYFTRPIVRNYLKMKSERTNADRLIGQLGIVIDKIDTLNSKGQVKVSGQEWSARSTDNHNIDVGETVEVKEIIGVKLIVEKKDKQ